MPTETFPQFHPPDKLVFADGRELTVFFDEARVPGYTLPDPLVFEGGERVRDVENWRRRRTGILELFRTHVYGRAPADTPKPVFKLMESSDTALNGAATRKQVSVLLNGKEDRPVMDILIYLPNNVDIPVPLFTALNFQGNHSVHTDPAIRLSAQWMRSKGQGVVNNRATEKSRGATTSAAVSC